MCPLSTRIRVPRVSWWTLALISFGCFGGQTGTEAVSTDDGAGGSKDGTQSGNGTVTKPTEGATCQPPATGVAEDLPTTVSGSGVVEFVRTSNPVELQYDDGSVASATLLISEPGAGCVTSTSSGPASTSIPVTIQVASGDGRVVLIFTGSAIGYAAVGGGVADVEVTGSRQCTRSVDSEYLSGCEVSGVDLTPFKSVTVSLAARLQSIGGGPQWLGIVRISGSRVGSCGPTPCVVTDWATVATISVGTAR